MMTLAFMQSPGNISSHAAQKIKLVTVEHEIMGLQMDLCNCKRAALIKANLFVDAVQVSICTHQMSQFSLLLCKLVHSMHL